MILDNRVRQCFWLFMNTLPISKEYQKNLQEAFGENTAKILPEIIVTVQNFCMKYPEDFDGYLEFVKQSIDYMRGDSDQLPEVDLNEEDYQKMLQSMRVQLGEYKSKKT